MRTQRVREHSPEHLVQAAFKEGRRLQMEIPEVAQSSTTG